MKMIMRMMRNEEKEERKKRIRVKKKTSREKLGR